jgi:hypothetical protein
VHAHTIVVRGAIASSADRSPCGRDRHSTLSQPMSPTWIWLQAAIVVFVLIGMIVAITKLA